MFYPKANKGGGVQSKKERKFPQYLQPRENSKQISANTIAGKYQNTVQFPIRRAGEKDQY